MIRTAVNVGAFAILLGLGVLVYRQVTAPRSQELPQSGLREQSAPPVETPARPQIAQEQSTPPAPRREDRVAAAPPPPLPSESEAQAEVADGEPAELVELPGAQPPAPKPEPQTPASASEPQVSRTHTVRSGDTLWGLSRLYYGSPAHVDRIAAANRMAASDMLRVGRVLSIPGLPAHEAGPVLRPDPRSPAPPDADHEAGIFAPSVPERAPEPAEYQPMPATLSRGF